METPIVSASHLRKSESKPADVTVAVERCRREIAGIEALILAGHPDLPGSLSGAGGLVG